MLNLFRALVSKEQPDYILEVKTAHYQQLYAATCKYAKGKEYFVAVTFYTDTWIGPTPGGPIFNGAFRPCVKLTDVATVNTVNTSMQCLSYPQVTAGDLESYVAAIRNLAVNQFDEVFAGNPYGDCVETKMSLAPLPGIIMIVRCKSVVIGTIAILMNGIIYPVFACNSRLNDYVRAMQELVTTDGGVLAKTVTPGLNRLALEP